jgi:hypothetical protein
MCWQKADLGNACNPKRSSDAVVPVSDQVNMNISINEFCIQPYKNVTSHSYLIYLHIPTITSNTHQHSSI